MIPATTAACGMFTVASPHRPYTHALSHKSKRLIRKEVELLAFHASAESGTKELFRVTSQSLYPVLTIIIHMVAFSKNLVISKIIVIKISYIFLTSCLILLHRTRQLRNDKTRTRNCACRQHERVRVSRYPRHCGLSHANDPHDVGFLDGYWWKRSSVGVCGENEISTPSARKHVRCESRSYGCFGRHLQYAFIVRHGSIKRALDVWELSVLRSRLYGCVPITPNDFHTSWFQLIPL